MFLASLITHLLVSGKDCGNNRWPLGDLCLIIRQGPIFSFTVARKLRDIVSRRIKKYPFGLYMYFVFLIQTVVRYQREHSSIETSSSAFSYVYVCINYEKTKRVFF